MPTATENVFAQVSDVDRAHHHLKTSVEHASRGALELHDGNWLARRRAMKSARQSVELSIEEIRRAAALLGLPVDR